MRYVPTDNRIITLQKRERQVGSILLAEDAVSKNRVAEVVAVPEGYTGPVVLGQKVFFDYSAGSIIEDNETGVYTVLDESDILAFVYDN